MYIQDKVKEYADEVFNRMDAGAHMYFCVVVLLWHWLLFVPLSATPRRYGCRRSCLRRADARNCVLSARRPTANATTPVGLATAWQRRPIKLVRASLSWASARRVRNRSTRQAKNAHRAGRLRTRLACASLPSASASHHPSFQRPPAAPSYALVATSPPASALLAHAGQDTGLIRPRTTTATASPS